MLFLRGKQGSFYLSSLEEIALQRWQLGGEQVPETLLFWDTSGHSTIAPQLLFCQMHLKYVTLCNSLLHCPCQQMADKTGGAWARGRKMHPRLSLVCISLWYVSLCPAVNHRWLLHNLLWTPMPMSLNSKLFCSQSFRWIHLQWPDYYAFTPENKYSGCFQGMSRRWKYSLFQRQKLPSEG